MASTNCRLPSKDQSAITIVAAIFLFGRIGVDDGTRTHDDRDHNPGLYQLSYAHHCFNYPPASCRYIDPSINAGPVVLTGRSRCCVCPPDKRSPLTQLSYAHHCSNYPPASCRRLGALINTRSVVLTDPARDCMHFLPASHPRGAQPMAVSADRKESGAPGRTRTCNRRLSLPTTAFAAPPGGFVVWTISSPSQVPHV